MKTSCQGVGGDGNGDFKLFVAQSINNSRPRPATTCCLIILEPLIGHCLFTSMLWLFKVLSCSKSIHPTLHIAGDARK